MLIVAEHRHQTQCKPSASSAGILSSLSRMSIRFQKALYLKEVCSLRYRKHPSSSCCLVTVQMRSNLTDGRKHCNQVLSRVQLRKNEIRSCISSLTSAFLTLIIVRREHGVCLARREDNQKWDYSDTEIWLLTLLGKTVRMMASCDLSE